MNIGYIMIVASMLIWGSIGILVKGINQPSEVIVFFRVFIGFISMLCIISYKKGWGKKKLSDFKSPFLIVSGVFLSLNWMFFFKALKTTTVAAATLSYYTSPVILTILSVIILKEKLQPKTLMAIFVSLVGIIVMVFNSNSLNESINTIGIIYGLIAALFYALVTISGKKLERISSYTLVLVQTGVSTLLFLPSLRYANPADMKTILLLILIGIVHTSLALTLYFEGVKRIQVQHVGILSYIDPLAAVFFAYIFLGEMPVLSTRIGGALILISSFIVIKKKRTI